MTAFSRRSFLTASTAAAVAALAGVQPARASDPLFSDLEAFSFDRLINRAARLAGRSLRPREQAPGWLADLDYDAYRGVRFLPDRALWRDNGSSYQVHLFHPGLYFTDLVRVNTLVDGRVQPIDFDPRNYSYQEELPGNPDEVGGHAGFRFMTPLNDPEVYDELIAFLGASYFRALGRGSRYGSSARGLAVNTGAPEGEEFPAFTEFWLEPPRGREAVRCYALLEGPSVVGAYRFMITPGDTTVVDVSSRLFFRRAVTRLGVAPLTSMFAFGPNDRLGVDDFRPRVHDSQGLWVHRADGTNLWRPLSNPQRLHWTILREAGSSQFGLMQRRHELNAFEDLEARYDLRPSVWVSPVSDFPEGSIALLELPTPDETHDNIVAFWSPLNPPDAGDELALEYQVLWATRGSLPEPGQVYDTRMGHLGVPGQEVEGNGRKVVIDFVSPEADPESLQPYADSRNGTIENIILQRHPGADLHRLTFDVQFTGEGPMEARAWLHDGEQTVTEVWINRLDEL